MVEIIIIIIRTETTVVGQIMIEEEVVEVVIKATSKEAAVVGTDKEDTIPQLQTKPDIILMEEEVVDIRGIRINRTAIDHQDNNNTNRAGNTEGATIIPTGRHLTIPDTRTTRTEAPPEGAAINFTDLPL